ncbi:uncharacterized protein (TIGR02145 family) [Dysgonomonas sp. PH5-45]|uniref:hypothetical protein n=1 Tax=unclassified Dysgonomonas TaxID=2630389 RepID=UPI00247636CF|nr:MULTISPECIES: hypothetical protein [unclassified Dysgonomonas]MDH6354282.1 uncharacterized protein (TIGR02145 family) [Dysgonomonas sp. PH5-45]MDH6387183.1 uncharacterized protein (TIGR02145 family) [Dysgonomonas sp. PH5-37]
MKNKQQSKLWLSSIILLIVCFATAPRLSAQVTIGSGAAPKDFSVLELISSQAKGLRMPQLTTAERDALVATTEFQTYNTAAKNFLTKGLTIFNTQTNCLETWNGSKWISMCADIGLTVTPYPVPDVSAGGGSTPEISIESGCTTEEFDIDIIDGATYATLDPVNKVNGKFTVKFAVNPNFERRSVTVRLGDDCDQGGDYTFWQAAASVTDAGCGSIDFSNVENGVAITVFETKNLNYTKLGGEFSFSAGDVLGAANGLWIEVKTNHTASTSATSGTIQIQLKGKATITGIISIPITIGDATCYIMVHSTGTFVEDCDENMTVAISSSPAAANLSIGSTVTLAAIVNTIGNMELNYEWRKNGVIIGGNTPTVTISNMTAADFTQYTCRVYSATAACNVSKTAGWSPCGAYTSDGDWITFMCHNLGATYTADPFTPSAGLIGGKFQWGRRADGHQTSGSGTYGARVSSNPAKGEVDNNYQVLPSLSNRFGKFITTTNSTGWLNPVINNLWGDGNMETVNPKKTISDPCPVGWKIPSMAQMMSIFGGTSTQDGNIPDDGNGAYGWKWTKNGTYYGIKVNGNMMLPVSGRRHNSDASVRDDNPVALYWTCSNNNINIINGGYGVAFTISYPTKKIDAKDPLNRSYGGSIRCVIDPDNTDFGSKAYPWID